VDTYLAVASKRDWRSYADRQLPADVVERILDAGRLAGSGANRQPWRFLVVESEKRKADLADAVYVSDNVGKAALVVAIVTKGGGAGLDVGRAAQNMMLAAWNEEVVSCPNGMPELEKAAAALALGEEELPVIILSFAYPARPRNPESRSAAEWSREANRKPLEEVVERI
jgi:nitroreductase